MTRAEACDLVVAAPALAGAAPVWFERAGMLPAAPHLARLLARGDSGPSPIAAPTAESALAQFGVAQGDTPHPPWAALAQAGDDERPQSGCWLRIDPVHLRADMAQLLLFASPDVSVTLDEARALAATVAGCLAGYGELRPLHPARWYLRLSDETALETVSLARVAGRDIRDAMPAGASGRPWRTLINEIQMQLFEHPVNQARATRGLPVINSVWPWGWGCTPSVPRAGYGSVTAASPVVRGLARLGGVERVGVAGSFPDWLRQAPAPGEHLVWLEPENPRTAAEPDGWGAWLEALERDWFAPLEQALRERRLRSVVLHAGDARSWRLTRGRLLRFWLRAGPWQRRLRLREQS